MTTFDTICIWVAELVPFLATLSAFIYGVKIFFKKGKALYLQIVTMAMGCYAMGKFYQICMFLTSDRITEGFTAAHFGIMGFFLFLFTANFGQIDGLLDDKTPVMKKSRYIALIAPVLVALTYIPYALSAASTGEKIASLFVWICALCSSYFNFKHAIISDLGYGFAKAIRPYNISAVILTFIELFILILRANHNMENGYILIAAASVLFSAASIVTMITLKKGVEAWTI